MCMRGEVGRASQQHGTPDTGKLTREGNHVPSIYFNQPKASYPEKVSTYQPLLSSTRGVGDLEGVPDTRSGGSVLEAPPGAEEGALPPRVLSDTPSLKP